MPWAISLCPFGAVGRFYVVRDLLKPSIVDRVLSSEINPTVARSSEAVRADGYEHRSTVLRGRAARR